MHVILTEEAETDLEAIGDYIAQDSAMSALVFTAELRTACLAIGQAPQAYPRLAHLTEAYRRRVYRSYLIVYRIADDGVYIVRVLHGARDLDAVLGD